MLLIVFLSGLLTFLLLLLAVKYFTRDRVTFARKVRRYTVDGFADEQEEAAGDYLDAFMRAIRRAGKKLQGIPRAKTLEILLQQAGLPLLPSEFILLLLLFAAVSGLVTFLLSLSLSYGVTAFFSGILIGFIYLKWLIQRRTSAISTQLGDALTMLSNALRSGFSFLQSLDLIAKELGDPLSSECHTVLAEMKLGADLESALQNMHRRVDSDDLGLVITAILIHRQVGGNLAQILDTISETIHDRIRIKREIYTLTAQGRLSGWVLACLPFGLAAMIAVFSPGYFQPLFDMPIAPFIIGGAVFSDFLGLLIIRKIVDLDV